MVKLTVNFDDPTTYHLYYGDERGDPSPILAFFPWAEISKGYRGTGQAITISFLISPDSIDFWKDQLKNNNICFEGPIKCFNGKEQIIRLFDPDGLELELVAHSSAKENEEI